MSGAPFFIRMSTVLYPFRKVTLRRLDPSFQLFTRWLPMISSLIHTLEKLSIPLQRQFHLASGSQATYLTCVWIGISDSQPDTENPMKTKQTPPFFVITGSLVIAIAVLTALPASAQTIFYDTFSGTAADLNGTTPTVGSGTWVANTSVDTNGSGLLRAGTESTNYLAFTLSTGKIYELSIDMFGDAPTSDTSQFAGIGFFKDSGINVNKAITDTGNSTGNPNPWMFLRTQNTDALEGDMSLRPIGTGTGEQAINSSFDVTVSRNYKLVLNTNDTDAAAGTQYSLGLFVNGIQFGTTVTYTDAQSTTLNTSIGSVGITTFTATKAVSFDNFKLEIVPEPSTAALLLAGLVGLTFRRRRRS